MPVRSENVVSEIIQETSLDHVKNLSKIDKIVDLPTELFNPYRLLILNYLYRMDFLSFTQLKQITRVASDGNLASHLRYLESQDLISVHKSYAGRYPKRFYELTEKGICTMEHLVLSLDSFLTGLRKIDV